MLLEEVVNERELIGDCFVQRAAMPAAVELETAVGFAALEHEQQARFAREVQHDRVLGQAMHEQHAAADVRRVQERALQQSVAVSFATASRIDAQAQLGGAVGREREMREADQLERVALDAEHAVAVEIDAGHILADGIVADRAAKAQAPVFRRQLHQMARNVFTVPRVQPLHRDGGHHRLSGSKCWAGGRGGRRSA